MVIDRNVVSVSFDPYLVIYISNNRNNFAEGTFCLFFQVGLALIEKSLFEDPYDNTSFIGKNRDILFDRFIIDKTLYLIFQLFSALLRLCPVLS